MSRRTYFTVVSMIILVMWLSPLPCKAQPCPDIDQECGFTPGELVGVSTYYYAVLQSFTPSMAPICAVELNLNVGGLGPDVSITVQIQNSVIPDTGVLSSVTQLHPHTVGQWILFDTPDIALSPGAEYFIYVRSDGDCLWWAGLPGCSYLGGTGYRDAEALDYDFSFRTYSGGAVALEAITWGQIKTVYR